ncbi:MAG: hypothetical protein K6E55_10390 [Thermoguttaceae bacterium]|nr:hypothetical protein [Thermoguttaceae bacterium]
MKQINSAPARFSFRSASGLLRALFWTALLTAASLSPARGERGGTIPSPLHYKSVQLLNRGEFAAAADLCREELGRATKVGQQRWIDSICYYAVLGECEFVTGNTDAALDAFESAIDIYMSVPDWIARVEYPTGTRHGEGTPPPWGAGARNLPLGIFPNDAMIRLGDPITDERIKQGGMLKNPELRKIDPTEILRCTALSLRRRNEILGPLSPYDHRSRPIVECFSKRAVSRNHWSSPLLDVMLGIALEGAGKHEEAVDRLNKSLLMEGAYDHFLASDALLALGDIYLRSGKVFEAADSYLEASVSAYAYGNPEQVEEALRKLVGADLLRDDPASAFPVETAAAWASDQVRSGWIAASMNLKAAERLIRRGEAEAAEPLLRAAAPLLKSAGLDESRYADLYRYLAAVTQYRRENFEEGGELLARAVDGARSRSFRFFQIRRVNASLDSLTPRAAAELYDELLRDSDFYDWTLDPVASLAADTSLWSEEMGNQFLLAVDRQQPEKAFEIAERIRVRRFLTPQEMCGRVLSLRLLSAAPEESLTDDQRIARRGLFADYPALETLQKNCAALAEQLRPFSILPDAAQIETVQESLGRLESAADDEETLLRGIAAMPFPVPEIFPPREPLEKTREKIPEKGAILSFIEIDGGLYGFFVTRNEFDAWRLGSVGGVGAELAGFLSACGASDGSKAKLLKEYLSDDWRDEGNAFFLTLLGHPTSDDARGSALFEQLAVVPDSILWYVPFGAMTLPRGDELVPIASVENFTLFCAPTVSLCFARGASSTPLRSETVIVPGKLHPKEDADIQRAALARLTKNLPKSALWPECALTAPRPLLLSLSDRLLSYEEIFADSADWPLVGAEGKKDGTPLSDLRLLPWGGPKTAVLPGLRSGGEAALKENAGGAEFFTPILLFESQGGENLLLSRWRVGGDSTYRLCESFLENAEKKAAPEAWKETLAKFMSEPLNLKEEPRFRGAPPKEPIPGEHPFFWGGYMLVCRGLVPPAPEESDSEDETAPADGDKTPTGPGGGETADADSVESENDAENEDDGSDFGDDELDGSDFGDEPSGPDAPDDEPSADDGAQADPPENEKAPPPKNRRGGGSVRKGSKGSDRQGERKRPADATSRMTYSTR